MNSNATSGNCRRNCWLAALVVGVLVAWYLMSAGWGFFVTLVIALVVFVVAGVLMRRWLCSDDAAQVSQPAPAPVAQPAPTPAPAPAPVAETAPEPDSEPEPTPETETAPEPVAQPAQAPSDAGLLKHSAVLPGQEELASRKGTWRYGGDPAPAPAAAPAETAPAAESTQDTSQGTSGQPAGLAQARDGGADNLKLIKGVGPKLERVLNGMGYFHFDQIAAWSAGDIEWVDHNLVGFKGRVSRDAWVDQAKALAAGEETEFAKRAKRDKIYD